MISFRALDFAHVGSVRELTDGLHQRIPVDRSLSRPKFSVVHLRMFAKSTSATAPNCHSALRIRFPGD
jgi:hypothetical protein